MAHVTRESTITPRNNNGQSKDVRAPVPFDDADNPPSGLLLSRTFPGVRGPERFRFFAKFEVISV